MEEKHSTPLLRDLKHMGKDHLFSKPFIAILAVVILLGLGSGYLLSGQKGTRNSILAPSLSGESVVEGSVVGSDDTKTFKDTAQGTLQEGGIDGEGQYHLVRPGGASQNVYMTSSVVDLSQFIGKKVKVWGETQAAQTAGWLMDVGRVEVLE